MENTASQNLANEYEIYGSARKCFLKGYYFKKIVSGSFETSDNTIHIWKFNFKKTYF